MNRIGQRREVSFLASEIELARTGGEGCEEATGQQDHFWALISAAGPDVAGETMLQPQNTEAQLLDEMTILRQQMAELVHDIKDPLGVIIGYARILLQEARARETVQLVEKLERINCSAMRICTLLARMSDL